MAQLAAPFFLPLIDLGFSDESLWRGEGQVLHRETNGPLPPSTSWTKGRPVNTVVTRGFELRMTKDLVTARWVASRFQPYPSPDGLFCVVEELSDGI